MRTRSSLATLVALSLSAATPVAAEAGSRSRALSWDGRCVEIASNFSVPVAGVRPLVPDGFTLLGEDTGSAQLNVGIARCPRMVVDGAERRPAFAGFTAVWTEPYEGFGAQRYIHLIRSRPLQMVRTRASRPASIWQRHSAARERPRRASVLPT